MYVCMYVCMYVRRKVQSVVHLISTHVTAREVVSLDVAVEAVEAGGAPGVYRRG
jgi:hypothetical protein